MNKSSTSKRLEDGNFIHRLQICHLSSCTVIVLQDTIFKCATCPVSVIYFPADLFLYYLALDGCLLQPGRFSREPFVKILQDNHPLSPHPIPARMRRSITCPVSMLVHFEKIVIHDGTDPEANRPSRDGWTLEPGFENIGFCTMSVKNIGLCTASAGRVDPIFPMPA